MSIIYDWYASLCVQFPTIFYYLEFHKGQYVPKRNYLIYDDNMNDVKIVHIIKHK